MHAAPLTQVLAQWRGLCLRPETDFELLGRFVQTRDADAFAQLVHRHAQAVWAVCRRVLTSEADCEDAFQATFVALARQAATLDGRAPLGCWLHTIAVRIAKKAQVRAWRRGAGELPVDHPARTDVTREVTSRELLAIVDEEIERLPQLLRDPLVLCCLEGRTRDEAAEAIGCSVPALKSRLERARGVLRQRLGRRGIELPAAFLAIGLGVGRASAGLLARAVASASSTAPPSVAALLAASPLSAKVIVTALAFVTACTVGLGAFHLAEARPTLVAPDALLELQAEAAPRGVEPRPVADAIGDPLPEAALLRLGTKRFRHPNSAAGLALSPDEKTVLTLGWEGLYAWDTATGKERWHADAKELVRDLNPSVGQTRLVVSPDGTRCITLGPGRTIRTWDVATGQVTTTALVLGKEMQPTELSFVDIAPDGKTLALGGPEGLFLSDLAGNVRARISNNVAGPPGDPNKDRLLAWQHFSYSRFAPDSKTLAVVTSDAPDLIKFCNAADGTELRRLQLDKRYLDSAFSPDGKLIAVAERDDTIRVYETETGKRIHSWKVTIRGANENYIFQVVFSPDGKTVAAASSDLLIRLWDPVTGAELGQLKGHSWYPWGLAFTADSKTLYSTGWDGNIRRWDLATRRQLPLPAGIRGSSLIAAAPDGKSVAYADGDRNIRIVNPANGQELRTLTVPDFWATQSLFAPDGRTLALGGTFEDKVIVCLLDVVSGEITRRWDWPKGRDPHASVVELAFTTDGRRLAAMSYRQGQARVWDLHDKDKPLVLAHQEGYCVAFHPDGKTLATSGWNRKIRFWDPTDGTMKNEYRLEPPKQYLKRNQEPHDTRIWAVAYSPDGTRLAGTDLDGHLWLWDAESMKLKFGVPTGQIFRHNCMTYSPDGLWLATGGAGGSVKVWDALSGQLVWDRGVHAGDLFRVSFGRDSRRLLTGAADGLGYLWDLRPKELPKRKNEELWGELVGADGPAAYRAFWSLLEQPENAVALLTERANRMLSKVRPEQITQWIADLDAAAFATREAAMKQLAGQMPAAAVQLRQALAKTPSLEQQRRLQRLLDEGDELRSRIGLVVSVLAHLDTPAARKLLAQWAEADAEGTLGRAAGARLRAGVNAVP